MTRLQWGTVGQRRFETGVDRGVLYPTRSRGWAWNGLTSVNESPQNAGTTPYYIDGVKYLNKTGPEEFAGTITAFTYPDQLTQFEGLSSLGGGLYVDQQPRSNFNISYRTMVGNDLLGTEYGYKIHIVYDMKIDAPSKNRLSTTNFEDPTDFAWNFTTTPVKVLGKRHSAHLVIDSRQTNKLLLSTIEDRLYGKTGKNPYLPSPEELIELFENYQPTGYGYGPYGHTTYGHGSEH